MSPEQVRVLMQSRNPLTSSRAWYQLMYGEEFGGKITPGVKIIGDVYVPFTSWASGKCTLQDVRLPYNVNVIALSIHEGQTVGRIGNYVMVKDFRISRGVYVSGLIDPEDHIYLKARVIIGYELKIYGRTHLSLKSYKKTQKQKDKSK